MILQKANSSSCPALAGYTYVPIDIDALTHYESELIAARSPYLFGGKDPNLGAGQMDFPGGIDCSGLFRTMSDYVTREVLKEAGLPDGSYEQAQWLKAQGFKCHEIDSESDYAACANIQDEFYRVCFHYPNGRAGDPIGHVWADVHQHSVESYGGHGPGERPILHSWFVDHCDLVVVLGPMVPAIQWRYPLVGG